MNERRKKAGPSKAAAGAYTDPRGLGRAELGKRTGCNLETIRYYEKIGLMPDPPRAPNGYRVYGNEHVRRLRFILRARELGFAIEEIQGLLGLVDGGKATCAEVQSRTERHLADVRAKIADLRRIERALARTVEACSGDNVPECPVLDALASASRAISSRGRRVADG